MGIEERVSEIEVKLRKEITNLQNQINILNSRVQNVHAKVTHPSTLRRIKSEMDPVNTELTRFRAGIDPIIVAEAGLTLVATHYIKVLVDGVIKKVGMVE